MANNNVHRGRQGPDAVFSVGAVAQSWLIQCSWRLLRTLLQVTSINCMSFKKGESWGLGV